jgi:hypothetical protein
MPEQPNPSPSLSSEPRWFRLALACRWPLAVVIAAWAVAVAAIQILKQPLPVGLPLNQPFPVRLVGGITVDQLKAPIQVNSDTPLKIEAAASLPVQGEVGVPAGIAVSHPVTVTGDVAVRGTVSVDEVSAPLMVHGSDEGAILVGTPENQSLSVQGGVSVKQVGGKINVQIRDAAKSLLPIP